MAKINHFAINVTAMDVSEHFLSNRKQNLIINLGCDYLHDIAHAFEKNAQLRCDLEAEAEEVEEVEEVEEPEYEEEEE